MFRQKVPIQMMVQKPNRWQQWQLHCAKQESCAGWMMHRSKTEFISYFSVVLINYRKQLLYRPEDGGANDSPTFIEAAAGEQPVLSGGVMINGWKKLLSQETGLPAAAKGNVWVADVPMMNGRSFEFRQLWVNGVKAVRAKSVNGDRMLRILNWNKKDESC